MKLIPKYHAVADWYWNTFSVRKQTRGCPLMYCLFRGKHKHTWYNAENESCFSLFRSVVYENEGKHSGVSSLGGLPFTYLKSCIGGTLCRALYLRSKTTPPPPHMCLLPPPAHVVSHVYKSDKLKQNCKLMFPFRSISPRVRRGLPNILYAFFWIGWTP